MLEIRTKCDTNHFYLSNQFKSLHLLNCRQKQSVKIGVKIVQSIFSTLKKETRAIM